MKSKKTNVLVIILCLTMVYMSTVYAATGFSEKITETKSIFSLPSNATKGLFNECIFEGNSVNQILKDCDAATNVISDNSGTGIDLNPDGTWELNASYDSNNKTFQIISGNKYFIYGKILSSSVGDLSERVSLRYTDDSQDTANGVDVGFNEVYGIITATKTDTANVKLREGNNGQIDRDYQLFIDMTANGIDDWSESQMLELTRMGYWEGVKSTLCAKVKSINKNLLNYQEQTRTLEAAQGTLKVIDGGLKAEGTSQYYSASTVKIKVKPSTQYTFKVYQDIITTTDSRFVTIMERDAAGNLIIEKNTNSSSVDGYIKLTFTTSPNCNYVSFRWSRSAFSQNFDVEYTEIQLEEGSAATSFVKYELGEGFCPVELHSTPDGTKCEFDYKTGKYTKKHNKYALQSGDIVDLNTTLTNVDVVTVVKPLDSVGYNNVITLWSIFEGWTEFTTGTFDAVDKTGKFRTWGNLTKYEFVVAKGTYANLAAAQADLAGTSLIYQLATPETTTYNTPPLTCYENGTVMVLPQVKESAAYNNGMSITNTNLPIKSLVRVDKIENGVLTPVDLSNATIAPDGLTFTIPGAVNGETYIYVYEYAPEISTIPTITYSLPINQDGQITGNTNAIQRHSDLIDIILQQIQLMRQEIQELKTMLQ